MRTSSVFSEAWRNIRSGSSHLALFAIATFLLLGALAISEVRTVGDLVGRAVAYRQAGATVTTFVSNGAIDGSTCQSLQRIPGVRAAGAIRSSTTHPLPLAALPANPIPTFEATPGFPRILLPHDGVATTGALIPTQVADTLSVAKGSTLLTADGRRLTIAAVYPFPDDGRDADLRHAIIEPVPTAGTFDQCWVETWPYDPNIIALAHMTLTADPPNGTTVTIGALNTTLGSSFNAAKMFTHRATAPAWAAAIAIGLAIGALNVFVRRRHLAESRHAGVTVPAQLLQTLTEAAAIPAAALPPAALLTILFTPAIDTTATWLLGTRILGIGAMATLIGAAAALATIRRRSLPRYLKD